MNFIKCIQNASKPAAERGTKVTGHTGKFVDRAADPIWELMRLVVNAERVAMLVEGLLILHDDPALFGKAERFIAYAEAEMVDALGR